MQTLNLDELNSHLYTFDQVENFDLNYDHEEKGYTLTLILSKDLFIENTEKLLIKFFYISDFSLNDSFLNNFQQFMSLNIEKNNDQLENVHYQISQIEDENIAFKCKRFLGYLI